MTRDPMNATVSLTTLAALLLSLHPTLSAAESIFSGPQPGEKTSRFKVLSITGKQPGDERDPIAEHAGRATALVFIHGIERSLVPLLRVMDNYGALRKDRLRTELVFLTPDRLQGEQRIKAAAGSLKLLSEVSLSPDGLEGPGNYGLNKECLMTVLCATGNVVTANFALVQPGIADAPKILLALAKACGDTNPPSVDQLSPARRPGRPGANEGGEEMVKEGPPREAKPKEKFPGAPPTDEKLLGLLRSFIRPTNDVATVDRVLTSVRTHVKGSPELEKQAFDGWTRVLHFGDRYGTEYARKVGRELLDELKSRQK